MKIKSYDTFLVIAVLFVERDETHSYENRHGSTIGWQNFHPRVIDATGHTAVLLRPYCGSHK